MFEQLSVLILRNIRGSQCWCIIRYFVQVLQQPQSNVFVQKLSAVLHIQANALLDIRIINITAGIKCVHLCELAFTCISLVLFS